MSSTSSTRADRPARPVRPIGVASAPPAHPPCAPRSALRAATWAGATFALATAFAAPCASAQEVYLRGGLPGAGAGYAQSIGSSAVVRVEATTLGTRSMNGTREGIDFDGEIKATQAGVYGDWFPGAGGFRLTGGVSANDVKFTGQGRPSSNGTITIGGTTVAFGPGDYYNVEAKYPGLTPYLGIGWGHHPATRGWGFVADLGVHIGSFKATSQASPSLVSRLSAAGANAQAEIDAQNRRIQDNLDRYRFLPVVAVGVSYRW